MHSSRISWLASSTPSPGPGRARRTAGSGGCCRRRRGRRCRCAGRTLFAVALDVPQDLRQLRPRHDAVLRAVARRQPADGAERLLAGLPQREPFRLGVGLAHLAGVVLAWRWPRCGPLRPARPASRPSTSMMSTAPASSGKPKWNAASTAREDRLVEHLQRGGDDAGADDVADGVGGVVDRLEDAEQRAIGLRVARDAAPRPS